MIRPRRKVIVSYGERIKGGVCQLQGGGQRERRVGRQRESERGREGWGGRERERERERERGGR